MEGGLSMKLLRSFLILTLVVLLSACNTATKVTKVQKNKTYVFIDFLNIMH